jgi:mono/diheme cytochrome c family protein
MLAAPLATFAQNDAPTGFSNMGGIVNTRHNMTQNTESNNGGGSMNAYRNRYGQLCVYCHTPHGANTAAAAPLWNRLLPAGALFTTYSALNSQSMTQTVYNPGAASLPCLSCHDGSQAVDAILNMPGSGQYSSSANPGAWIPIGTYAQGYGLSPNHLGLDVGLRSNGTVSTAFGAGTSCLSCHNPGGGSGPGGTGLAGDPADFTVFLIGRDLRNDHPIGVTYPASTGGSTGWNTPGGTKIVSGLTNKYFDENGNGRMDKEDIRLYDTGNGASVECASCHDPHGVPSGASGSVFFPTFLRKTIDGSGVCLTCHAK